MTRMRAVAGTKTDQLALSGVVLKSRNDAIACASTNVDKAKVTTL